MRPAEEVADDDEDDDVEVVGFVTGAPDVDVLVVVVTWLWLVVSELTEETEDGVLEVGGEELVVDVVLVEEVVEVEEVEGRDIEL